MKNIQEIKEAPFFALMINETLDISRVEQVSILIRIFCENLSIKKIFWGFFDTKNTMSETIFEIVEGFFAGSGLSFEKLRGQCYDGIFNMSREFSGLQERIKVKNPRAIYVHCISHRLNFGVQDAMEDVTVAKNFIGVTKDLINFIRDSPKRIAEFKEFQVIVLEKTDLDEDHGNFSKGQWISKPDGNLRVLFSSDYDGGNF